MQNEVSTNEVPFVDVKRAVERILASRGFANSKRLSRFLSFAVEQTLEGNADALKEYTIGIHAYGRKNDFDPSHDTIVRTEARRLRGKLKEYYEGEGQQDEVVIFFRSGSYVPVIHWRRYVDGTASLAAPLRSHSAPELWKEGDGVWVAVTSFVTQASDGIAATFAFGLRDEILHRLTDIRGIRVITEGVPEPHSPGVLSDRDEQDRREIHIVIGGTVRTDKDFLRVTVRAAVSSGIVLWSQRFDTLLEQVALTKLQEAIAATLLSRVAPRDPIVQRFAGTPTETMYKLYSEVLAAESLVEESSHASLTKALKKFEELKERAPNSARLDCGIAECCIGLAQRGGFAPDALVTRATEVARALVAKFPELPEAHSILGMALGHQWKWDAAEKSFRTGLRLGDQHSIHRQFAVLLLLLGRIDESWENLCIAREIDPLSTRQKVAMARFFYYSRRHKEASQYYEEMSVFGGLSVEPAYYRALSLVELGRAEDALAIAHHLSKSVGRDPAYLAGIAELYALCGATEQSRELVERHYLLSAECAYSSFRKARLSLVLEDVPTAIQFLNHSFERTEPELPYLAIDPRFDRVRSHETYRKITAAVFPK